MKAIILENNTAAPSKVYSFSRPKLGAPRGGTATIARFQIPNAKRKREKRILIIAESIERKKLLPVRSSFLLPLRQ